MRGTYDIDVLGGGEVTTRSLGDVSHQFDARPVIAFAVTLQHEVR